MPPEGCEKKLIFTKRGGKLLLSGGNIFGECKD